VFRGGFVVTLGLLAKPGTTSVPPFMMRRPGEPPSMPRVGVEFSDGRRGGQRYRGPLGARLPAGPPASDSEDEVVVHPVGAGMGGPRGIFSMGFWVSPLPPAGPVRAFFEWSAQAIAETSTTLSGDEIRRAAQRVAPIWE
jgi:hypothetical protein